MVLQFGSSDSWSCSLQEVRDQGSRIEGRRFVIGDFEGFRKSAFGPYQLLPEPSNPRTSSSKLQPLKNKHRETYLYIYIYILSIPQPAAVGPSF